MNWNSSAMCTTLCEDGGLTLAGKAAKDQYVADVIRPRGDDHLRAMLWHVKQDDNTLTFLAHPQIAAISEASPDAVVDAVLKVLNSIGARAPSEITQRAKLAPKGE
jgi:hypothetical protein